MDNPKPPSTTSADLERLKSFPAGYRFKPRDHELIMYYLKPKLFNKLLPWNLINEVYLYRYIPEDLIAQHPSYGEREWYFFTPRDKKYRNGSRPNRAAGYGAGYWKATGADKKVEHNGIEIGFRKSLVFYRGKPPQGEKTDWMMYEFRLKDAPEVSNKDTMRLDDWVLCKIYKKVEGNHTQAVSVPPLAAAAPPPPPAAIATPQLISTTPEANSESPEWDIEYLDYFGNPELSFEDIMGVDFSFLGNVPNDPHLMSKGSKPSAPSS